MSYYYTRSNTSSSVYSGTGKDVFGAFRKKSGNTNLVFLRNKEDKIKRMSGILKWATKKLRNSPTPAEVHVKKAADKKRLSCVNN